MRYVCVLQNVNILEYVSNVKNILDVVFPRKMTGRRSETTEIATQHRGRKKLLFVGKSFFTENYLLTLEKVFRLR